MEQTDQLYQDIPILFLGLAALGFAGGTLVTSVLVGNVLVGRHIRKNRVKDTPYECGMIPVGDGNSRMSVKFYLVAMLFILFDIEVVFMYPWAVVYKSMLKTDPNLIFGGMLSFLGILFVGYIYALKKRAFDWKS